jgi:autoinducer 2 (AI-2) kinase
VPDRLWQIVCDVIREALDNAGIKADKIAGASATSQREGMVLLDNAGKELYAGPNIDLRAVVEGITIDNKHAREIHSITGHLPSLLFAPAKLKWLENNHPELFSRIATVLTISDWIIYKLSGEMTSEVCSAAEIGLIDIREKTWSAKLVELLDLPRAIYPVLTPAGSLVGKVAGQAADATGIIQGTPVVQGAPDTHCGLLGMGVSGNTGAGIVTGWSIPVQMVTSGPVLDAGGRIWSGCHVYPDKWILESNSGEAGHALSWLKETMFTCNGASSETAYELLDKEAFTTPPGAEGVIASIGPGVMDMTRLSMGLGGFFFPLPLSISGISRGHLARAVLENICFAIKANLLQLETLAGSRAGSVCFGGNMTGSLAFRQVLPSVLDRSVQSANVREVSALGAAILAAAGSGIYSDINEAMSAMRSELTLLEPDFLAAGEYADYYQQWLAAVEKFRELKGAEN